jgi:hypothetical protein
MRAIKKIVTIFVFVILSSIFTQLLLSAVSDRTSFTIMVTNTNDSGEGSLRDAITKANTEPGPNEIAFSIPQSDAGFDINRGTWTIKPLSVLPAITDSGLVMDGASQVESIGSDLNAEGPEIVINGSSGTNLYQGFMIQSSHNVIRQIVINDFRIGYAISISEPTARENTIVGCYLGTNAAGTDSVPNLNGINIYNAPDNLIGDVNTEDRNIISGNLGYGISIYGETATGNRIFGNYIGLDKTGSKAVSNGESGISLGAKNNFIGGFLQGERNVISGNRFGMRIGDDNNFIFGNYIGTNATGTDTIGNEWEGLGIWGGENNQIGGDIPEAGNLICGNQTGILIHSNNNRVLGNYIGSNANYTQNLGNLVSGIHFSAGAKNNIIGPKNIIAYNGYNGVTVYADSTKQNTITQNSITANSNFGIEHRFGGNNDLPAPSTITISSGVVSGTAPPNSTVEIFSDDADEGKNYEGTTTADANGNFQWDGTPAGPYVTATATDIEGNTSQFSKSEDVTSVSETMDSYIPIEFGLSQNYPNPFNPATTIQLALPARSKVKLKIHNLLGETLLTLLEKEMPAGIHNIKMNGKNLNSGVYFYCVQAINLSDDKLFTQTRKFVLLK